MLPLVVAGIKVTWRRALAIAVSGLGLLAIFALINHFFPATGNSDIGSSPATRCTASGGLLCARSGPTSAR